jgi:ribonuclease BN (tRNA processing enzyme)
MKDDNENRFQVLMLGVGDFFSRLYYSTCFVVLYDKRMLLVECPDPLRRMVYDASKKSGIPLDLGDLDDVLVTHIHGDHSNGLEGLGFFKRFIHESRPTLYTIPEMADILWENKLCASMGMQIDLETREPELFEFSDFFNLRLLYPEKTNKIYDLDVKIRYTKHFVPCVGLKIGYRGKWLGYSSDTKFDPEHIEFLSDCDLIFHETNTGGHTPYEQLLSLPETIRNKMMLVHIPDEFDTTSCAIPCAMEGQVYSI